MSGADDAPRVIAGRRERELTTRIVFREDGGHDGDLGRVAATIRRTAPIVVLTGAGMSVESGIPDFRSPGGLWTRFDPGEYATLSCFLSNPQRAWELYRALGETIAGKQPNAGHRSLADMERAGVVRGIVTQNVDGLHQAAGSRRVVEMHGDHRSLHCLRCHLQDAFAEEHLRPGPVPACPRCGFAMKPDVVLFEEPVRGLAEIADLLAGCSLLLVAGTSAEVVPASLIPRQVLARGGSVVDLNLEATALTGWGLGPDGAWLQGPVGTTLPALARLVLDEGG